MPSQDQALQQVVMLKKELAEMRANQALAEDKIIASKTSLDREVGKARGMITPINTEADMERSAHRETMDTLERSEQTVSYNTVQANPIQYNTIAIQYSTITIQYNTVQYNPIQYNTIAIQYSTITILYSTMQYSTIQYSALQCNSM